MRKVGIKVKTAAVALALAASVGGCTSIRDHRGYLIDQTLLDSVQPGIDNRQSVEKTLGRPTFESQFGQKDWYYISQTVKTPPFRGPRTTEQTILRVRFDAANNVVAVDKRGMEQVARLSPDGHVTPTLGRHRSLLEDLFGNIGSVGAAGMGASPGGNGSNTGPGPNGS
ncbi:outer membrane protein assembly factor BamE [Novosphingobium sp. Leaf2]|uniref:outer membrane protein assembly factor BamE n=1 Tax=Novosphingobium sp. Leaf2 TaxID=1735670 RepID=UPI0006F5E6AA|nr:outer membrane protein assembly factor BamE [Novosphingobium sp. Leaf2]KQM19066.1 cell envelope protein SmpA [Novosphingobium sp. Leaf2]